MRVDSLTILGLVAAFCTTFAYLPQVMKAWRTRSTQDISLGMFLMMATGVALWLAYGLFRLDLPLIASNVVSLMFALTILVLKLRHG
jgi:MtN3 and saliva related transmembrane protein